MLLCWQYNFTIKKLLANIESQIKYVDRLIERHFHLREIILQIISFYCWYVLEFAWIDYTILSLLYSLPHYHYNKGLRSDIELLKKSIIIVDRLDALMANLLNQFLLIVKFNQETWTTFTEACLLELKRSNKYLVSPNDKTDSFLNDNQ